MDLIVSDGAERRVASPPKCSAWLVAAVCGAAAAAVGLSALGLGVLVLAETTAALSAPPFPALYSLAAGLGLAALAVGGAALVGRIVHGRPFAASRPSPESLARHEEALRAAHLRFDAALNNMSQGLCMFDADNVLLVVNRRFCEIYRLDPSRIVPGITFRDIIAASIAAGNHAGTDVDGLVRRRLAFVARRASATTFQELADGRVIAISHEPMQGGGWVVTYEDITERRRAEAQITHMARHDQLTGLPNRMQFRERIEAALSAGQAFAVVSLDLDDFRAVNQAHGLAAGDHVLCEAARRIAAAAPEGSIVARLGADEFAVLLFPLAAPDAAACLAERLIAALSAPWQVGAAEAMLSASAGIAVAPGDGDAADRLLAHADLARDIARRDGRGSYRFFEPGMDQRQQRRRQLEADLRQALANGEFLLHYQPVIDIGSGAVTGFEALLRWKHPRRGLVSPAEFIPLAEQNGLIVPIGAWVLEQAAMDAARFPGAPRVAVNVSPLQFRQLGLVEAAAEALARAGLSPDRLELEITESVLLDESSVTRETLHRLRVLGLRIAIDDFGTGYSSLRMLRGFPFDKIKIDQGFIRDLGISPDARSIVSAIAGLGRALGMSTTAEGVETEEQLSLLAAEGCAEAQGYLFSRPRPAEEVPMLLRTLAARGEARALRRAAEADQAAA